MIDSVTLRSNKSSQTIVMLKYYVDGNLIYSSQMIFSYYLKYNGLYF